MPDGGATDREGRLQHFKWVYDNNQWGRSPSGQRFYSDSPALLMRPLQEFVSGFVARHDVRRVVDLACGDFELGSGIDFGEASYVGIDLYDELVDWVRNRHGRAGRSFVVSDIIEDQLPDGDLCTVHMALYLFSFSDAKRVLKKLRKYRWVLITDGQPREAPSEKRNTDKPTDKYTRQDYFGQGFYLESPPFNLDLEVVHEFSLPSGERVRTVLLDHAPKH